MSLRLRGGLTLRFPALARAQGAYTTNFFRTESPISEAGQWVNGVAGRLNPRSHGPAWLWCSTQMDGRPVHLAKTVDIFKATMSTSKIAAYLRGMRLFYCKR